MNWWNFRKWIGISVLLLLSNSLLANDSSLTHFYKPPYKKNEERWLRLMPKHVKIQVAGGMGLISAGPGWSYGKNKNWETDFYLGYIPLYATDNGKLTATLKQTLIPWNIQLNEKLSLAPLTTGLYINSVIGSEFWISEPEKYGSSYYAFSTKLRFNIFLGQAIDWQIKLGKNEPKPLRLFYELSTSDLYLISGITNKYLKATDYIGLSLGVKWGL